LITEPISAGYRETTLYAARNAGTIRDSTFDSEVFDRFAAGCCSPIEFLSRYFRGMKQVGESRGMGNKFLLAISLFQLLSLTAPSRFVRLSGDMTGKESYYTVYAGHEVMYHVSTMLPYSKDNPQQLERKRHIGNDIVNIIYTDDPSALDMFNPNCIKSQFTRESRNCMPLLSSERGTNRKSRR